MALLLELAQYLEDQTALKKGTTLFNSLPASPDSCVSIQVYPGQRAHRAFRSSAGQPVAERPRVQILSRSTTFNGAMSASLLAQSALDGLGTTTMSGVEYLYIEALQPPFEVLPNEDIPAQSKLTYIAQNYEVTKRVA